MAEKYDLNRLSEFLDLRRDELFQYAGLSGLLNRYALKRQESATIRNPQYFFMRIAMGLAYNEADPTGMAKSSMTKCRDLNTSPGFNKSGSGYKSTSTFKLFSSRNS